MDSLLCFHLEGTSSTTPPKVNHVDQKPLKPGHSGQNSSDKTGFVPQRVYKIQSDWYHAVRQRYGLPLDSRHLYTKTDWEFFAAAVTSISVRQEILQSVALWVNETSTGAFDSFPSRIFYLPSATRASSSPAYFQCISFNILRAP